MKLKLLVSPVARGAYFDAYLDVARAELRAHFPQAGAELEQVGGLDFLAAELEEAVLPTLARLSFFQGAFCDGGAAGLEPLALEDGFLLPQALVFGAKYQGKTNELETQLAINLALLHRAGDRPAQTLLDPMAGRGTSLLWALRYGLHATGIEKDPDAPAALHAHLKKQAKLHRIKHSHRKGFVGKKNRKGSGGFVHYEMAGRSLRLVTGDGGAAPELLSGQRFDLIVTDLPYGVRFRDGPKRSPLELVAACAGAWVASLRAGGAMVLVFNSYQPRREELVEVFAGLGCSPGEFSAPHRMSESIVRDLLVLTR